MKLRSEFGRIHFLSALAVSFIFIIPSTVGAPAVEEEESEGGCYYMFAHYEEGDRIMTNEPCLNCTCHNSMLMCYLRVCPFTKPIGQDCTVEKKPDQCCPTITCPEVPVSLVTPPGLIASTSTVGPMETTALALPSQRGCEIDGEFYPDGAQVATDMDKPCELCYCIRNRTACVMQECILHVEGCEPVFQRGVCCPVRYKCDFPLAIETTTIAGLISTTVATLFTTPAPGSGCMREGEFYRDGSQIPTPGEAPCEHCYCMRGEIVCAVQDCGSPLESEGGDCKAIPPRTGLCCPEKYTCPNATEELDNLSTKRPIYIDHPLITTTTEREPEVTSIQTPKVSEQQTTPSVAEEKVMVEDEGRNATTPHSVVESTESFEALPSTTHAALHGLSTEKPSESGPHELQDEGVTTEREPVTTFGPIQHSSEPPKIPGEQLISTPTSAEESPVTEHIQKQTTEHEGTTESISETSPYPEGVKETPVASHPLTEAPSSSTPSSIEETSKEVAVTPEVTETVVTSEATENPLADETEKESSTESQVVPHPGATETVPVKFPGLEVSTEKLLPTTAAAHNLSTTTEIYIESEGTTPSLETESQVSQGTEAPGKEVKPQPVHSTPEPETVTEMGEVMEKVGAPQNLMSPPPSKTTMGTTHAPNVTEVIPEHSTPVPSHVPLPEPNLTETSKAPIGVEITTEEAYATTILPAAEEVPPKNVSIQVTHQTTSRTPIPVEITTQGEEEPEATTSLPPKELVNVTHQTPIKPPISSESSESGSQEMEATTVLSPEQDTSVGSEESKEPETSTTVSETVGQNVSHPVISEVATHSSTKTPISAEETTEEAQEPEATTIFSRPEVPEQKTTPTPVPVGLTTGGVEATTIISAPKIPEQNVSHPIEIVDVTQTTGKTPTSIQESKEPEYTTIVTPSEVPQQNASISEEVEGSSESHEPGSALDKPSGSSEEETESPESKEDVTTRPEKVGETSMKPAEVESSDAVSESDELLPQTTSSLGVQIVTESVTEPPKETTPRPIENITESAPTSPNGSTVESGESSTERVSGSVEESTEAEEKPTEVPLPSLSHSTESEELRVSSTTVRVEIGNLTESELKPESPSEETATPSAELSDESTSTTQAEVIESTPVSVSRIPGEGSCFVEGVTYKNGSRIPPSTPCQLACACQNSIVHCLLVHCPGAPYTNGVEKCRPTYTPDTCCPTYNCTQEEVSPSPVIVTPETTTGGSLEAEEVVTVTPQPSNETSPSEHPPAEMSKTTPKAGIPVTEQPITSPAETTPSGMHSIEVSLVPAELQASSSRPPSVQETTVSPTESKVDHDVSEVPETEVTESSSDTTHPPDAPSQIGLVTPVSTSPEGTTEHSEQKVTEHTSAEPILLESTTAQSLETSSEKEESSTSHPQHTIGTGNDTAVPEEGASSTESGESSSVESIPAHDEIDIGGNQTIPEESTPTTHQSTTLSHQEAPIITTPVPITIEGEPNATSTTTAKYPVTTSTSVTPSPAPWPYPSSTTGAPGMSSGACLFDSRVYMSAQQIPRDDPCDFCFCFRGDIICLQQSCPPPIPGCYEEPIPGFCCPRYECPVGSNNTTTPVEAPPSYYNNPQLTPTQSPGSGTVGGGGQGCEIQGEYYEAGQLITATSGPCLECRCGSGGIMECDPRECQPEPMLRKMIEAIASR